MNQTILDQGASSLGTIVIPAYNEGAVIGQSLAAVVELLRRRPSGREWEVLVVDDGSADETAQRATAAAAALGDTPVRVRVLRHAVNRGLGGALQTGFAASRGNVVVVVDCDLSYSPDHIPLLVEALDAASAQIAVASPYMPGGRTVGVPAHLERRSRAANKLLGVLTRSHIHTFTGMVRAYDGPFVRDLALRSMNDLINVEALYKTAVLRGRVVEVPATLDWTGLAERAGRSTMMLRRTRSKTYDMVVSGLLFRPYVVFAASGALLVTLGAMMGLVAAILPGSQVGLTILGVSTLVTGLLTGLASLISVQIKRSFEELYYLQSAARHDTSVVTSAAAGLPDPLVLRTVKPAPRHVQIADLARESS